MSKLLTDEQVQEIREREHTHAKGDCGCFEIAALLADRDALTKAAQTLGGIVDWQVRTICKIANVPIDDDPDTETAWELALDMPGKIAALTAERDALVAEVEQLRSEKKAS